MTSSHYDAYLGATAKGLKQAATKAVRAFVEEFESPEAKREWTTTFLETHPFGEKLRHEIYAEVVFPTLNHAYEKNDAWAAYWLAGTTQNLYNAQKLWVQTGYKTDIQFLKEALDFDPNFSSAKTALRNALLDMFDFAIHEWPAGILLGMNGASVEGCAFLRQEIALVRTLTPNMEQAAFVDDFEQKLTVYEKRL